MDASGEPVPAAQATPGRRIPARVVDGFPAFGAFVCGQTEVTQVRTTRY